ncbi:enoyl-CoA hydratase/isomerase family protein [Emticicia sp. TH156]|uniref:enoyl-CoA hydratase/isomerase family protein n=1 Tax=Emticicia sp. TH156 TaxID=2067454 RepID=UPI000C764D4F|nr:enoyl-CoA hydratase-related protein [Emticicia sp. TH156]PLK43681.1 enoyl-CoA hydratase [Emticicia sp. TH156]
MFFSDADVARFPDIDLMLIKTEQKNNVFSITLNRPEKRNAFTPTMVHEMALAIAYAQANHTIWCVLLQAEGPVFCAGMDLNVFQNPRLDVVNTQLPALAREVTLGDVFRSLYKPSIAIVKGDVLAGGFLITGGCTFVIATQEANFSLPEVKRGVFPMQVMASLLKIMPPRKVLELSILGRKYTAKEALDLGIVTQVSTADSIDMDTCALIETILSGSPYAIRKGIEAYHQLANVPENEQNQFLLGLLKEIRDSADAQEGILAFKDKRPPVWQNK